MRYGFNYGLMGSGGGGKENVCITLGSDAVGMGFFYPTYGSALPTHTENGVRFYQFTWYTNGSSDVFTVAFGDSGNDKIEVGVDNILIKIHGKVYIATWQTATTSYTFASQYLIDSLNGVVDGDEFCMYLGAIPDLAIDYDFEIKTGDKGC